MEKLIELANAIKYINVVFGVFFVILAFAIVSCFKQNNKADAYEIQKWIFYIGVVAIILDIIWTVIGIFNDVSITIPIVCIVIWVFICLLSKK